jgi:hypothetical protein
VNYISPKYNHAPKLTVGHFRALRAAHDEVSGEVVSNAKG